MFRGRQNARCLVIEAERLPLVANMGLIGLFAFRVDYPVYPMSAR